MDKMRPFKILIILMLITTAIEQVSSAPQKNNKLFPRNVAYYHHKQPEVAAPCSDIHNNECDPDEFCYLNMGMCWPCVKLCGIDKDDYKDSCKKLCGHWLKAKEEARAAELQVDEENKNSNDGTHIDLNGWLIVVTLLKLQNLVL